jgi:hypothetical protein
MKNSCLIISALLAALTVSTNSFATCEYEDVVDACLNNVTGTEVDSWRCEADVAACFMNVVVGDTSYECGYGFYQECGTVGGYICGWYDVVDGFDRISGMVADLPQCEPQEDRPDIDPVNPNDPPPPVVIVTESIPAPSECVYTDIMEACLSSVIGTQVDSWRCAADVVSCYINVVLGDTSYECGYGFSQSCGTVGGYICGWYDVVGPMQTLLPDCTPQENRPDQ